MKIINQIKELIDILPEKDKSLANSFIKARNFDSLESLIVSIQHLVDINNSKKLEEKDPKWSDIDEIKLRQLVQLTITYNEQFYDSEEF